MMMCFSGFAIARTVFPSFYGGSEGQGTVVDCAFSIIRSVSGGFGKILEFLSIEFRVEIDPEEKESMIE